MKDDRMDPTLAPTPDVTPPGRVTDLTLTGITQTGMTASWTAPAADTDCRIALRVTDMPGGIPGTTTTATFFI